MQRKMGNCQYTNISPTNYNQYLFQGYQILIVKCMTGCEPDGTVFSRYTQTRKSKNFQIPLYKNKLNILLYKC